MFPNNRTDGVGNLGVSHNFMKLICVHRCESILAAVVGMKHWYRTSIALDSPQKNVGSLIMGADAIATEKRGPFFANAVLREISLKAGYC
jgi:hypothetical protein